MTAKVSALRSCLCDPVPEIYKSAEYLDAAVTAYLAKSTHEADRLIRLADIPAIAEWTESLWGAGGPWSRPLQVEHPLPYVPIEKRVKARMPSADQKRTLIERDGFQCRFCGIPLIRARLSANFIRMPYDGETEALNNMLASRRCGFNMIMFSRTRGAALMRLTT